MLLVRSSEQLTCNSGILGSTLTTCTAASDSLFSGGKTCCSVNTIKLHNIRIFIHFFLTFLIKNKKTKTTSSPSKTEYFCSGTTFGTTTVCRMPITPTTGAIYSYSTSASDSFTITNSATGVTEINSFCNGTNLCNTGTATDSLTLECNLGTTQKITCPGMCVVSIFS